jgi:hypothetical protein
LTLLAYLGEDLKNDLGTIKRRFSTKLSEDIPLFMSLLLSYLFKFGTKKERIEVIFSYPRTIFRRDLFISDLDRDDPHPFIAMFLTMFFERGRSAGIFKKLFKGSDI